MDPPKVPIKVLIIFLYTGIFFGSLMDSLALLCADHLEDRSSKLKYVFLNSFLQAQRAIFMDSKVVCGVWNFLLITLCYALASSLQALIPCLFSGLPIACG